MNQEHFSRSAPADLPGFALYESASWGRGGQEIVQLLIPISLKEKILEDAERKRAEAEAQEAANARLRAAERALATAAAEAKPRNVSVQPFHLDPGRGP